MIKRGMDDKSESAAARRREGYMFVTFDCSLRWPFLLLRFRFLRYRVRAGETMQRTRTRQKKYLLSSFRDFCPISRFPRM